MSALARATLQTQTTGLSGSAPNPPCCNLQPNRSTQRPEAAKLILTSLHMPSTHSIKPWSAFPVAFQHRLHHIVGLNTSGMMTEQGAYRCVSQAGGHFRHFWHLGHLGHLVALGFFVRGPSLGPGLLRWAGSRSCMTIVIERPVIWAGFSARQCSSQLSERSMSCSSATHVQVLNIQLNGTAGRASQEKSADTSTCPISSQARSSRIRGMPTSGGILTKRGSPCGALTGCLAAAGCEADRAADSLCTTAGTRQGTFGSSAWEAVAASAAERRSLRKLW